MLIFLYTVFALNNAKIDKLQFFEMINAKLESNEKEKELSDYVESFPEVFVQLSSDLKIIKANNHFYNVFEIENGDSWIREFSDDFLVKFIKFQKGNESSLKFEFEVETKGWFLFTLNKHEEQFLLIAINIQEMKKNEEELEQQKLTSFNAARLAALGEMAGGITHEINNPLAIISGSVFALKRSLKKQSFHGEKVNERLFKIEETVKRISNIILGMRNLSRSELSDSSSHFNLMQLINDTLNLCHERFLTEEINLSFDDSDFDQEVLGSYQQYGQILINLLNNAFDVVKNKNDKYVGIEIVRDEGFVSIRVVDSGDGISEVSKLFQPFYTIKSIGEGTGFGLSISKKIAQKNVGDLLYFRKKDKTVFEIKIPKAS